MALTATQRVQIRFYLGWSARFHQFDSRLEQAMNAVDTSAETEVQVESVMADIASVLTKLSDAHSRLKAAAIGSITLPGMTEVAVLRAEGRRHASSLAATLGVEVRHDIFSSGRYRSFATVDGLVPSNVMLRG